MALVSPVMKAEIPIEIIAPLRRAYNNLSQRLAYISRLPQGSLAHLLLPNPGFISST